MTHWSLEGQSVQQGLKKAYTCKAFIKYLDIKYVTIKYFQAFQI